MAVTDTSDADEKSREENLADIAAMRAGRTAGGPRSGRPLKLLILAAVLLIAGAAAWFFLLREPEQAVEEDFVPKVVEEPTRLSYVKLEPMFIPLEAKDGRRMRLIVTLALEIAEDGTREVRVRGILPRLHEAYLRALSSRPLPRTEDGRIEAVHIKNRVRAENLRILGPDVVHDVVVLNAWVK